MLVEGRMLGTTFVTDLAKLLSVQSRSGGNFVKFVNRLVRQFAMAFKTLLSVTFHVVAPNCNIFGEEGVRGGFSSV